MDVNCEEFGVFFRGSADQRMSVVVNLTVGDDAPVAHLPTLLRVLVAMPIPRKGTRPQAQLPGENGTYAALELELISALEKRAGALFVARELTFGQLHFYFYAPLGTAPDQILADVLQSYPSYRFRTSRISDPEWTIYFDELYPSRIELQLLNNHERQCHAVQRGDRLEEPRSICHWIFFSNLDAQEEFLNRISHHEFKVHLRDQEDREGAERRYCVELARHDRADHPFLDELVLELYRLAEECGGEYDSFEEESYTTRLLTLAGARA